MTPAETKRMHELCSLIQFEKDHKIFTELVHELNALLEQKEERLEAKDHKSPA
jgi:hypothetical protein